MAHGLYYNPIPAIYLFPPGDDINRFLPYKIWNSERNFQTQNWAYSDEGLEGLKQNPFWIVNENRLQNRRNRFILTGTLNYNILDWLTLSLRGRMDRSTAVFERKLSASTDVLFAHSDNGYYSDYTRKDRNMYGDFLLNMDKGFGDNWRIVANFGGSFNDEMYDYKGYEGSLSTFPDHFHVGNLNIEINDRERYHTRTTAFYATAQVGYKSMLFLDLTGRIDHFSQIYNVETGEFQSTKYPSVGLSGVLTEMFNIPRKAVPFWKVRASYTQVGNPPEPYLINNYTSIVNGTLVPGGFPVNLKPERTKAFEVGTDMRLWENRFDISFTYYNTNTYNQLFMYSLPPSTGQSYTFENAGKVNNYGIELKVGIRQDLGPVKWNGTVTYSLNRNKIKELLGDTVIDPVSGEPMDAPQEFEVASNIGSSYRMILKKGGTMSDIYVNSFKLDEHGYVYVHPVTGAFSVDTENYIKIGSAAPLYNLSMSNSFAWQGVTLGFMIDARVGG
ncbi:MAG: TonB-dependent receptor, partial [Rikenellaceae bacterium]|nr:TonB-dependent receptor [Rikenellaceae bacterium]